MKVSIINQELFYFDAEKNFGADVDMKYRFNAGLRFAF